MAQIPNYELPQWLCDWKSDDVIAAVNSVAELHPTDTATRVIQSCGVDGSYLEREIFPQDILQQMFPSIIKQLKFVSCVSSWRAKHDRVILIRTSNGQSCVLSKSEFPNLSLASSVRDVKAMAERKLGVQFGLVVCRDASIGASHMIDDESLRTNQIHNWGASIFVDVNPKRLPRSLDGVNITVDASIEDMITGDGASDAFPLAIMCGGRKNHALSAHSMTLHIKDSLRRYQYELFCPDFGCRARWDWDACVRVACLSYREREEIEERRERNRIHVTNRTKTCPNAACGAPIARPKTYKTNKVKCLVCDSGYFCWRCLNPWRGGGSCGNENCITQLLQECETVDKWSKGPVPVLRACPRCDEVMRYQEACNHIICPNCSYEYCIICLKAYRGHSSSSCSVAGRQ